MTAEARLAVAGPIERALDEETLRSLDGDALGRFLAGRRWFAGKGGRIVSAAIRDVVPLFPRSAVARLDVDSGTSLTTYQLPLAVRESATGAAAPLARVSASDAHGVVVDAADDLGFLTELGRAFAGGRTFSGRRVRWRIDDAGRGFENPRAIGAEQSNSSVAYGEDAILKFYRRVMPGIHPDVEIGTFLTARGFAHAPRLHAVIRFDEDGAAPSVAGAVQEFVPSRGDAWREALSAAKSAASFAGFAADLGRATAALHATLASAADDPAFAPRPLAAEALRAVAARVVDQVGRALELAASQGRADLGSRRSAAIERVRSLASRFAADAGLAIRHHGDFHLGQVLVGRDGRIVIVDFEGEPAKPLEERRGRASALRDVAGMVRSFAYAAHLGAGPGSAARAWEESARGAFLEAYVGTARSGSFLPASADALRAGIALFELEKAFYELEYEIQNRPDWIAVPLAGVERVLGD